MDTCAYRCAIINQIANIVFFSYLNMLCSKNKINKRVTDFSCTNLKGKDTLNCNFAAFFF